VISVREALSDSLKLECSLNGGSCDVWLGKSWDEIIPEVDRHKVDEEELHQQLVALNPPPRSRKTVHNSTVSIAAIAAFYYPYTVMLAWYKLWPMFVCVSICLLPAGVPSKWLNRSSQFVALRLPSTLPTLCYEKICVSPKVGMPHPVEHRKCCWLATRGAPIISQLSASLLIIGIGHLTIGVGR